MGSIHPAGRLFRRRPLGLTVLVHVSVAGDTKPMDSATHNAIVNFVWGIADDVLRDLYLRGKYRDVIPPMTILRRLDAVPGPTEEAVLDMKAALDRAGITNRDPALRHAAGHAFDNTS